MGRGRIHRDPAFDDSDFRGQIEPPGREGPRFSGVRGMTHTGCERLTLSGSPYDAARSADVRPQIRAGAFDLRCSSRS
jgi:hypothetical protein